MYRYVAVEKRDYFAMRIVNVKVAVIAEIMLQKMRTRMRRKMEANLILMAIQTAVRINMNIDIISYIFLSEQMLYGIILVQCLSIMPVTMRKPKKCGVTVRSYRTPGNENDHLKFKRTY